MKNRDIIKSLGAMMMAIVVCVSASLPVSAAEYADWATSHVNIYGAPGDASHIDKQTIFQRNTGARVVCNYNSHTNANASTGRTTVQCVTYAMDNKVITTTGEVNVFPDLGTPNDTVSVTYRFIAYTPTAEDTFWAKGNIRANP